MRFLMLLFGLLTVGPCVSAWSKEDREIFRVRAEVQTAEGSDVTFYDYLDVKPSASQDEISRAYRKRTLSLHPDKVRQQLLSENKKTRKDAAAKNKNSKPVPIKAPTTAEINRAVKIASEKQERLSLIVDILRGPGRERYDHFLHNGFPLWKGTDYYYNRYRPGLGTVLVGFCIVVGGGFHYLALYMSWKRQREFMERYIKFARNTAWGDTLGVPPGSSTSALNHPATAALPSVPAEADPYESDTPHPLPQPRNRRERRMLQRDSRKDQGKKSAASTKRKTPASARASGTTSNNDTISGPTGARKRVVAENGKILVVDSLGDVYLEEEDASGHVELFLLDPNEITQPTFHDTAVVRAPVWIAAAFKRQFFGGATTSGKSSKKTIKSTKTPKAAPAASTKKKSIVPAESDSDEPQDTPDSTSDDFEILDRSTELGDKKVKGKSKKR